MVCELECVFKEGVWVLLELIVSKSVDDGLHVLLIYLNLSGPEMGYSIVSISRLETQGLSWHEPCSNDGQA